MLTDRQAFKVGFLARCVEDGLSIGQIGERVKEALDKSAGITDLPGKALDAASKVVSPLVGTLGAWAPPIALAGPPILGGGLGYAAAKATDVDDTDVDEIKNQELIDEYRRQTAKLKREKKMRAYAARRKETGRVFL